MMAAGLAVLLGPAGSHVASAQSGSGYSGSRYQKGGFNLLPGGGYGAYRPSYLPAYRRRLPSPLSRSYRPGSSYNAPYQSYYQPSYRGPAYRGYGYGGLGGYVPSYRGPAYRGPAYRGGAISPRRLPNRTADFYDIPMTPRD